MDNMLNEPALKYNFCSLEEYIEIEATSTGKNEYYNGQLIVMQGASLNHNRIVANLIKSIGNNLNGKSCEILPSDVRLKVTAANNVYVYPDAMIICGKPELTNDKFDTVTNPAVLFEVISESSENNDRRKFFYYMQMSSVKEIIMVNSYDQVKVEVGVKQDNGSWQITTYIALENEIILSQFSEPISLKSVYENIIF
jgi:Uma2 family endonuclease